MDEPPGAQLKQYMYFQYMLDTGDTQVDEATLRRLYLPPYQAACGLSGASECDGLLQQLEWGKECMPSAIY